MQKKDQIAELFRETFDSYEVPVRSGLWEDVASKIDSTVPPTDPGSSVTTQVVTGASKISGSLMTWIGGAALVASIGAGIYLYDSSEPVATSGSQTTDAIVAPSGSETTAPNETEKVTDSQSTTSTKAENNNTLSENKPEAVKNNVSATSNNTVTNEATAGNTNNTNNSALNGRTAAINTGAGDLLHNNDATVNSSNPTVTTDNGSANTVNPTESAPAKIVIEAQPASGKAPLNVRFSTPATAVSTEWHFGDGSEVAKGNNVNHLFTQPGSYLVTLKTTDENGTIHTEIKRVEVLSDLTITNIPNVFTPNGDGLNDEFSVKAAEGVEIEVSIFDTGGKLVHRFTGSENSWNGKINNLRDAEAGTYFYVIFATGQNGDKNTQKGTLSLKR